MHGHKLLSLLGHFNSLKCFLSSSQTFIMSGRKKSEFVDDLCDILISDHVNYFVKNEVFVLPQRNDSIYIKLAQIMLLRSGEKKSSEAVFQAIKRNQYLIESSLNLFNDSIPSR